VDEIALIRDTINHYGPVFIASLSIQIRRAGVQKKFGGRAGRRSNLPDIVHPLPILGLVCWLYGGISPEIFVSRLKEAVSLGHFFVGMIKAPFMAFMIGIIACSEGLRVKGSAESLGAHTTASVVKSVFLVIVLDGLFAMFFASIGK
jgi:hypothetical protein